MASAVWAEGCGPRSTAASHVVMSHSGPQSLEFLPATLGVLTKRGGCLTMAAAALTTWTHLACAARLISEALSLTHHEALSLDVISYATSLLLWVTSVLLQVVLYPLQAAAGRGDGRGVLVGLWVGCRAAGARL